MRKMLDAAGFVDVSIEVKAESEAIISSWMPGSGAEKYVASAYVTATKPLASAEAPYKPQDDVFDKSPACCPPPKVEVTAAPKGKPTKAAS